MKRLVIFSFLVLGMNVLFSQAKTKSPEKIDDICFCKIGLLHPNKVLYLDNNLELLVFLKQGKTLEELSKSNIKFTFSQIRLLLISGLIKKEGTLFYTTVPILTEQETLRLRQKTKKIATEIAFLIQEDLKKFLSELELREIQKNSYSLFFSFVLDGLVWEVLEEKNIVEKKDINEEKPFWNGVYWIVKPKRNFSCGTNTLTLGKVSINENWSDNATISVSSYENLERLLNDYITNGKITKEEVFRAFSKNDLFDETGRLKIPVIQTKETDAIYVLSLNIAGKIAEYLRMKVNYSTLLKDYSLNQSDKTVILYHEIMWDILTVLEEKGLVKRPMAFEEPKKSKDSDLRDLLFIVKE